MRASQCGPGRRHTASQGRKETGSETWHWLTGDQGQLCGSGLRRHELAVLTVGHLQQREGHWAIVDLRGKAGHVRTIPVPDWVTGL